MPIEVDVTLKNGKVYQYYIPLRQMRGAKKTSATLLESWAWVDPQYAFEVDFNLDQISLIQIDPRHIMADVELENNQFPHLEKKEVSKKKSKRSKKAKKKKNKK